MKTLIIVGHPNYAISNVSRAVIDNIKAQNNPDITINILWENYPDYKINVEREQELLKQHSKIVFLFPTQWYAVPSLLKKWEEDVLLSGFAYGKGGDFLKGKIALFISSAAGDAQDYSNQGNNLYSIMDYYKALYQTCRRCFFDLKEPMFYLGVYKRDNSDIQVFSKKAYEYITNDKNPSWDESSKGILV